MIRYIDTHSHPHFPHYDADRDAVFARMREAGVATIAVGTSLATSKGAVDIAGQHSDIWAVVGVHPNDTEEMFDAAAFAPLLTERVVGIGECGLDYFRGTAVEDGARQKKNFEAQIALAIEYDLPLMLHVRPSKGSSDAHDDAIDMLKSAQGKHGSRVRGNAHFFTGDAATARRYWDIGFTTAFPGVITFAPEVQEVVRVAPLDMILSETDAPYAAPVPHRGQRNEPAFVIEIVQSIATIKQLDEDVVREALLANAKRVFSGLGALA
ncbi:MAG: TatD family hydrolase [Parcubacteria group bacterium]|nr:TatD family hydrolase [Parcubacteria group bacterium]